jgi:hypothetical protein
VHAHHHVARVDEPPDLRDVVGHVGLVDHGREPHLLRGAHHGGQVQQEPRAPARDDQQPGLIRAEGRGRVPRQRERAAEEPREVWRREPVGDELPVRAEADHGAGEAVRLPRRAGLGEVEDRVPRQSAQQPVVLDQPPRRHVGHHQLYVPSVLLRGGVERDEHVGEVVEDVARVPADRERHRGGRVRRRAPRRGVGRRRGAHSDLRHAAHARLVALPRVRPHLVPLAARRRVHDHERRRVRVHPDVAGEVAHVGPEVGEVAQRRLLLLLRWPLLEPHLTIPNLLRRLCTRYKRQHHITHAAVMDLGSPVHGVLV